MEWEWRPSSARGGSARRGSGRGPSARGAPLGSVPDVGARSPERDSDRECAADGSRDAEGVTLESSGLWETFSSVCGAPAALLPLF